MGRQAAYKCICCGASRSDTRTLTKCLICRRHYCPSCKNPDYPVCIIHRENRVEEWLESLPKPLPKDFTSFYPSQVRSISKLIFKGDQEVHCEPPNIRAKSTKEDKMMAKKTKEEKNLQDLFEQAESVSKGHRGFRYYFPTLTVSPAGHCFVNNHCKDIIRAKFGFSDTESIHVMVKISIPENGKGKIKIYLKLLDSPTATSYLLKVSRNKSGGRFTCADLRHKLIPKEKVSVKLKLISFITEPVKIMEFEQIED